MTYREVLSPAVQRVERLRTLAGIFLGPLVLIVLYLIFLWTISLAQHRLTAGISLVGATRLMETIFLSITEMPGSVLLGVAPAKAVFALIVHPLVSFFVASFILAEVIISYCLHRRLAFATVTLKFPHQSPLPVFLAIGLCIFVHLAGIRISFSEWMVFTLSITSVMFIYSFILLKSGLAILSMVRKDLSFHIGSSLYYYGRRNAYDQPLGMALI